MPLKIPAHMLGEWHHPQYGKIKMDQQKMDEMKRNFADNAIGRKVFVRIGHDKANKPTFGDAPAEATVTELRQEGNVLYAFAEPADDNAAELIRKYRYISPEYQENYKSKLDGSSKGCTLEAIALTNEPFIPGLPENRLLSDFPDGFTLNFGEVKQLEKLDELLDEQKKSNGLLGGLVTKLSDLIERFKTPDPKPEPTPTPSPAPAPTPTPAPQPAAVNEEVQRQLADMQTKIDLANATATLHQKAFHASEVERRLTGYVAKGIPTAVINDARPILLADIDQAKTIKLADDKMISASEQVYTMLDNFPEASRVKFGQQGSNATLPINEAEAAESRKLAEQAMIDLGYKVVDGKFVM